MASSASHDWATSRHVTNTSVNRSVAVLGFADVQTVYAPRSLGAIGTASAIPGGGPLGEHPDALRGLAGSYDDKSGYGPAGQQQQQQYHQAHYGGGGSSGQQGGSLVRQSIGSDLGSDELRAHSRNGSFSYGGNAGASNPESPRYQPTFQQPGAAGGAHHALSAGSGLQPIMSGEPIISPDSLPPLPGYPDPSQFWQQQQQQQQQQPQQGGGPGLLGGSMVSSFSTTSDYSNGGAGGSYHGGPQLSMSRQGSGQAPYGGGSVVQGSGGSFTGTPRRQQQQQQQLGDPSGGHNTSLGAGLASGSYGRDAYAPHPQPPSGMYGPPLTPGRRSVSEELAGGGGGGMYGAPSNGVYGSGGSFTSGNSFTGASPRHGLPGGGGSGRPGSAGGPMAQQQGYGGGPGGPANGRNNSFGAAARGRSYPPPPPHVGGGAGGMYRPGLASPKAPYSPRHGGGRDDSGNSPFMGGGGFDASRARGPPGGTGRGEAERGQGYRKLWAQV